MSPTAARSVIRDYGSERIGDDDNQQGQKLRLQLLRLATQTAIAAPSGPQSFLLSGRVL